jgi:hypothetical protein
MLEVTGRIMSWKSDLLANYRACVVNSTGYQSSDKVFSGLRFTYRFILSCTSNAWVYRLAAFSQTA